jgi:hypothetical protein
MSGICRSWWPQLDKASDHCTTDTSQQTQAMSNALMLPGKEDPMAPPSDIGKQRRSLMR